VNTQTARLVKPWILRRYPTTRAFSLAVYGEKAGHQKTGHISRILSEDRPIPAIDVEPWIKALGLSPSERRQFILLAALSHVPSGLKKDLLQSFTFQEIDRHD
jgi:hypothetical protein